MLNKSKFSAAILAFVALASMLATFVILELVFFVQDDLPVLGDFGTQDLLPAAAAIAMLLFFIVLPGAYLIYRLDEAHFGLKGGLLWVLFGVLAGALATLVIQLIPSTDPDQGFLLFLLSKGIRFGAGILVLGSAYLLSFRMGRMFRRP